MVSIINNMLEDIIGFTAENLASELGNAFFEAAKAGEDAMEAWHQKVNDIVGDIIKRMLITQYLEPKIGEIFQQKICHACCKSGNKQRATHKSL